MTDANRVPPSGSRSDEDAIVRLVEAHVDGLLVQVGVLAQAVGLLRTPERRAGVNETIQAIVHNLGELIRRLHRPEPKP
jgi:hypothetical protein